MALASKEIQIGSQPTAEALNKVKNTVDYETNYDGTPKLSTEELSEFKPANPEYYKPKKQQITLKLDADVIAAFKKMGKGYQTKMNAALRKAVFS